MILNTRSTGKHVYSRNPLSLANNSLAQLRKGLRIRYRGLHLSGNVIH
jgi:hypothetical protein